MKSKGQNITEFAIIIALISIASIFVLTLLGGNISLIYQGSNDKVENFDPFNVRPSGGSTSPTYSVTEPTTDAPVVNTTNVSGYDVQEHADGSYSFDVGGQTVNITKNVLDNYNTVLQTTGASGLEELITELAYLHTVYAEEIAAGTEVTVKFGDSEREAGSGESEVSFEGSASVNSTTISVGNHIVIITNDQNGNTSSPLYGKYRIEGTLDDTNSFINSGALISFTSDPTSMSYIDLGTFNGQYSSHEEQFKFNNEKIHAVLGDTRDVDWDIDFK